MKKLESSLLMIKKTELKTEIGLITHLQKVTKMLDSYFVKNVARLIQSNNCHINI
jgi:hypothetical protein